MYLLNGCSAQLALCVLLFSCPFFGDAFATEYDVYLLAGQSNMDGRGQSDQLTEEQRRPSEDAIIFYRSVPTSSDGWQPLGPGFSVPPKYKDALPSPTFGPELAFARAMGAALPGRKLALIKGSKGGTSLRADWNPGVHGDPESQGPRYRDLIETIRLATGTLVDRGDTFEIRGLLWHQGESDSKSPTEIYQQRLETFVARIREDVGVADLPVVVGEVFDNGKRDRVRAAISAVGHSGPTLGFVSSEGTKTWDEGTHFDASSQLLLGKRYADAMLAVQSAVLDSRPKVVCFGDSITNRGYPAILGESLGVEAINAGVGGNTTTKALRRMKQDVLDHKPDVVVIFFGTNDLRVDNETVHVPVAEYRDNLSTMIAACRQQGASVVLCTLPPIEVEPFFTRHDRGVFDQAGGLPKLIAAYQQAASRVATDNKIPLVDLQTLLTSQPEWLSDDGVHPSDAGNAIIAKHIGDAVAPLLKTKAATKRSVTHNGPR